LRGSRPGPRVELGRLSIERPAERGCWRRARTEQKTEKRFACSESKDACRSL
jgi:hypothetical protein